MSRKPYLAFVCTFALAAALTAQDAATAKAKPAAKSGGAMDPVVMPAADMKWTELDPTAPGIMIADVTGNHATGPFTAFIKFPGGFAAPLHTHTNTMKMVVVSGTFVQQPEGKAEFRLGPGSYLLQPGGNYKHTTGCDKASDCVVFAQGTGKFDLKMVGGAKK